jgi:hypothetical protein
VLIRDNSLPSLSTTPMFEFWGILPAASATVSDSATFLGLYGMPSNYVNWTNVNNGLRVAVTVGWNHTTGAGNFNVAAYSYAGNLILNTGYTIPALSTVTQPFHLAFTVGAVSGTLTLAVWFNGVQYGSPVSTTYTGTYDYGMLGTTNLAPYGEAGVEAQASAIGQVAIYPYALPAARMLAHFNTGSTAAYGDTLTQRLGKLVAWSGMGLPYGSTISPPSPLLGNADQIESTALADALYATSQDEGGMYYAPATALGEIWYATRTSLYNRTPKYTFGDNGTTEIPYAFGSGFDYSDQFIYNIISSQRTISAGQGLYVDPGVGAVSQQYNNYGSDAIVSDQTSEQEYFPRGPLQLDIETTSDQDAFDRANWALVKYKQPQLRANQISVDCAAHPAAFATMLDVEQGDIVTVNRRPIGAPTLSVQCIVQQVQHQVGPDRWDVTLTLAPYYPENDVIQLDASGFNQLGDGVLGW